MPRETYRELQKKYQDYKNKLLLVDIRKQITQLKVLIPNIN